MKIVFMGSPGFAILPLQKLIQNGHEVVAVYTGPDKPAGRGREPVPSPIKNAALSLNLTVIQISNLKTPEAIEQLSLLNPDVIVVASFGQFLPKAALNLPRYGCLNIHPSLLPQYRGPSPVISTLLDGHEYAGVSVMLLDTGMDTGPIYSRSQIPISELDDNLTLTDKLFQIGAAMVLEVLAFLPTKKIRPEPQNENFASVSREIVKEDGKIDWNHSAQEIWRLTRAFRPWPEAYTYWQGKQLKIVEATPINGVESLEIGKVIVLSDRPERSGMRLGVITGHGLLGIIKLQIEGKKVMSAEEFIRGQRDFAGSILG
jgi:methionyl-tRNA formyltransferase